VHKRTVLDLGASFLGLGTPLLLLLVTVPAYLALLGEEPFGLLNLLLLLIVSLEISDLGLGNYFAREGAKAIGERVGILTAQALGAGALAGGAAGLAALIGLGSYGVFGLKLEAGALQAWLGALVLAAIAMVLSGQAISLVQLRRGLGHFPFLARNQLLFSLLQHALSLGLLYLYGASLALAILGVALARVLQVAHLLRALPSGRLRRESVLAIPWKAFVAWSFSAKVAAAVIGLSDRLMVAAILGLTPNTLYALAWNAVTKFSILPQVVNWVAFPIMTKQNVTGAGALLKKLSLIQAPVFALLLVAIYGVLEPAFLLWLGPLGKDVAQVGAIMLPGVFFNALAAPYATSLMAQNRPRALALAYAVQIPLFLALLGAGMVHWGLPGAALAWSMRCALDWLLLLWISRSHHSLAQ
jgi:O-antigen/teichoic acid export membrane protein